MSSSSVMKAPDSLAPPPSGDSGDIVAPMPVCMSRIFTGSSSSSWAKHLAGPSMGDMDELEVMAAGVAMLMNITWGGFATLL